MKASNIIRIAFAAAVIFHLVNSIEISEAIRALEGCNPSSVALALLLIVCSRILMPVKFEILLRIHGICFKFMDNLKVYYLASFSGLSLPSTLGADGVRIYCMKERGFRILDIASAVFIERLIGLLVTGVFAGIGVAVIVFGRSVHDFPGLTPIVERTGVVLGILSVVLLCFIPAFRPLGERLKSGILHGAGLRLRRHLTNYRDNTGRIGWFTLLTVVEALLSYSAVFIIIHSVTGIIPGAYITAVIPVHFLILRLPVSVAGWGLPQFTLVCFLSQAGVAVPVALAAAVLHQSLLVAAVLPGAVPFLAEFGLRRPGVEQQQLMERIQI